MPKELADEVLERVGIKDTNVIRELVEVWEKLNRLQDLIGDLCEEIELLKARK